MSSAKPMSSISSASSEDEQRHLVELQRAPLQWCERPAGVATTTSRPALQGPDLQVHRRAAVGGPRTLRSSPASTSGSPPHLHRQLARGDQDEAFVRPGHPLLG